MKKTIAIIAIALLGFTFNSTAQKIGHYNPQKIQDTVPAFITAQNELIRYRKEKEQEVKFMGATLQKKIEEYNAIKSTLSDVVQKSRENDLNDMRESVSKFLEEANKKFQEKEIELYGPLYKQLEDAINAVGKANKFTYIFDLTKGVIVYFEGGNDVTDLIIKELMKNNIPKKPTTTTTPKK